MAKAFLSHSSTDKVIAEKIAKQLGNQNAIIDSISFEAGKRTLDEIFKSLDKSDIFVIFISDCALNSKWVTKEIRKAKENISKDITDRILPIIIDKTVTHLDERIPAWISKPYNLKYISNEVIVLKKIKQALREISFKNNKFNVEIEKIFVGRNDELKKFENDINNLDNWTPTFIVAYNYFEGIGRRTFLKNALRKTDFIEYQYTPTVITIDSKESVENFIYKLNTLRQSEDIIGHDFSQENLESKINLAKEIINEFLQFKEIIFIIDDGGIILPNGKIVDWFNRIVTDIIYDNNLIFCLVSKYRPNQLFLKKQGKSLTYRIPHLSKPETKNLFLKLLNIYKLDKVNKEDKEYFIHHLNGIPSQIIYAVNLIEINPFAAKKNVQEIIEYSDKYSSTIINHIQDNHLAFQITILLSRNEIFSMDLINKVFGENEETSAALQVLFDLSMFNFVFDGFEYLKLNPIISDYISRSKIKLDVEFKAKLNEVTTTLLSQDLDSIIMNDYSEFMLTLQSMLEKEIKIPKKYFLPSLIIKNVIKEYDKGNYKYVIRICLELLENPNYDNQVVWETTYRLCLAYARTGNSKFYDYINYFKEENSDLDYLFLLGFYNRNILNKDKALDYYYKALEIYSEHSITKREVVNILLSKGKYDDALEMAKGNYEKQRTNIFHIQSYFICLTRKRSRRSNEEIQMLKNLIKSVNNSNNTKSEDIHRCMIGEYEYYVNDNFELANNHLLEAVHMNKNKKFPKKSLLEIYKKEGFEEAYHDLESNNFKLRD